MTRMPQFVLVASALACSWLLMQAVHELGHVLAAWATGGTVQEFVLHPLTISHTDVAPNPAPLTVVWAGPLVGVAIPLALATIIRVVRLPAQRYANFFAGFCLIANGAYLAAGAFTLDGDPAEMLRQGSPRWLIVACGSAAFAAGLWIWHRVGEDFGFGHDPRPIHAREARLAALAAIALTAVIAILGHR